jgi:hypothetical protein
VLVECGIVARPKKKPEVAADAVPVAEARRERFARHRTVPPARYRTGHSR